MSTPLDRLTQGGYSIGAVVLPIRGPLLTLKSVATVQRLSRGRLLLGVASGDRSVEYPLSGRDFDGRTRRSLPGDRRARAPAFPHAVDRPGCAGHGGL